MDKPLQPGISVVVPVYNSAESLLLLVERLHPVLQYLTDRFELILLNDGSKDNSWETIQDIAAKHSWVVGKSLMRNYGQHNALLCGIRAARYDKTVTMDDDLQHPPEELLKLLAKLNAGYDVVYGAPEIEQHGLWRDIASRLTKIALAGAMGEDAARKVSAFRMFKTRLRDAFATYDSAFVSIDVFLTWGTTRFAAEPVRHDPRRIGKSNYSFRMLVIHAFNMMTGFSTVPLQFASWIGISFAGFGFLLLIYVLGRYLIQGTTVAGFPFLASTIAIFSGVQLLALGIIGEYLARIHFRTMKRPAYVIDRETEQPGE